jgi:hypothetical protein
MGGSSGNEKESSGRRRDRILSLGPRAVGTAVGLAGNSLEVARGVGRAGAKRALDTGERALGAAIDAAVDSPRTQRLLERALAQPGMRRLVESVIGSEASKNTVDQLLESDEMEQLVGEIAESPQVRGALAAQTTGLASEVGAQVRTRAAAADSLAERIAQRLIGRRPAYEAEHARESDSAETD